MNTFYESSHSFWNSYSCFCQVEFHSLQWRVAVNIMCTAVKIQLFQLCKLQLSYIHWIDGIDGNAWHEVFKVFLSISNLYRNLCTQLSNNSDTIRMNVWTVDLEYEKMRCFLIEYISWKSFISEFVLLFLPCRIPFIASQWRVRLRSIQFVLYSHHMYLLMECILNKLMYQKYNLRRSFIWEFLLLFLPSVSPIIGEFVHEKKAPHLYTELLSHRGQFLRA